jgi:sugar/nucleoside kinase (ribokinase family)
MSNIEIISLGELLVEVMRPKTDLPLNEVHNFVGPFPSGAPAIFTDAAAKLGHKCGFIGAVGQDDFGRCIIERLEKDNVDVTYIKQMENHTTGVAFVTYFANGDRKFIFHISNAAAGQIKKEDINPDYIKQTKFLHITGSSISANENLRGAAYKAIEILKNSNSKISFDPNLRPELLGIDKVRGICAPVISNSYVVLPSSDEAQIITGENDTESACKKLLEIGPEIVVLKQGAKGCKIYTKNKTVEIPAFKVEAVDPTGAGDCFDAGFVTGLLEKKPLEEIGLLANAMGALGTTKLGAMEGTHDREYVEKYIKINT